MQPCCDTFEAHTKESRPDGFRVYVSLWMVPYVVRLVKLVCQIDGQPARSVSIHFCPWCGRDLETNRPVQEPSQ